MHEASLVQGMFDIIEEEMLKPEVEKVTSIELEMGTLSNAEPLLLEQAFEIMKIGTIFGEARFKIHMIKTEVKCPVCKHVYYPDLFPFLCPECDCIGGEIVKGDDIIIKRLEMELKENGRN